MKSMKSGMLALFGMILIAIAVVACEEGMGLEGDAAQSPPEEVAETSQAWTAVTANLCSSLSDYSSSSWSTSTSSHFTYYYFSGTPAATDLTTIKNNREAAYTNIRAKLGMQQAPTGIGVYLSPNRVAAKYWGRNYGWSSYPTNPRVEVIYNGVTGSYEKVHYGHEIAHVLIGLETYNRWTKWPLPFVTQGLAELLDQAASPLNDYHQRFVNEVRAVRWTNRATMFEMDWSDFEGSSYGKSGSFMKMLDSYAFDSASEWNAFLQHSACTYTSGHYVHSVCGTLEHPSDVACVLEYAVNTANGGNPSYDTIFGPPVNGQGGWWRSTVFTSFYNGYPDYELPSADKTAIQNLLDIQSDLDCSGTESDWQNIRSIWDGFYCENDWWNDTHREQIARRMARCDMTPVSLTLDHAYSFNTINFPAATLFVTQVDTAGGHQQIEMRAEKFANGWRITRFPEYFFDLDFN